MSARTKAVEKDRLKVEAAAPKPLVLVREGKLMADYRPHMTVEQVDLMRRTICPDLNNDEASLFVHYAQKHGADPLSKEAWVQVRFSKKKDRDGKPEMRDGKNVYERRLVMGLSRHQLQKRLEERPDFAGMECGVVHEHDEFEASMGDGSVKHVIKSIMVNKRGVMVAAWVRITRTGKKPYLLIRYLNERRQQDFFTGKAMGGWATQESTMLEKCAMMDAIRACYPKEFGDVHDEAEAEAFGEAVPPGLMVESVPSDATLIDGAVIEESANNDDAPAAPTVPTPAPMETEAKPQGDAFVNQDQMNALKALMQEFKLDPTRFGSIIENEIKRRPKGISDVRKPEFQKIVKAFDAVRLGAADLKGNAIEHPPA